MSGSCQIIAIDGPSGTGKSTTAKRVANHLNWCYLDTGAMYRALTWSAMQKHIAPEDFDALVSLAASISIFFDEQNQILIDGVNRELAIRSPEVSAKVSYYCTHPLVRNQMTEQQRQIAFSRNSVLDGRDIGTVVFPNAAFKFFLVADYKERAKRRWLELQQKGIEASLQEIEENLKERDRLDTQRETAPLVKAADAVEIDTTKLTIDEQVNMILEHVGSGMSVKSFTKTPRDNYMSNILHGSEEDLREIEAAMADFEEIKEVDEESLAIYGDSLNVLEEQKVVTGIVRQITDSEVLIDVHFKSEGSVPRAEFRDVSELEVGKEIEVFLESQENEQGRPVLSKLKADFVRVWEKIHIAFENDEVVTGLVSRRIKGGVVVDLFGIDAFLPGSQIDLRQIPDINALIGEEMELKVIKVNKARRNIVVSRRVVLEEERHRQRGDVLDKLDKGAVLTGVVKNVTDFGAFIDLGGVDGLLHITDMSYRRISNPQEVVKLGEEIEVMVLDFNDKKERISLGLKQLQAHPWKDASEKYPEGSRVKGKVVSITDYGAFIELDMGIEGLIHVSEMSWTQHIKHPSKLLNVGDEVEAIVLKVDVDSEKISLGLKQLEPDPWESIETELPPGAKVVGEIRNLASFGAFVEIKEGVDGLIHVSDMSWTKKINHPSEIIKKGDKVECVVLAVDRDKRRISLSMKHLEEDPWDLVDSKYPQGTDVKGAIIRMLDRGVVLELEDGMEGFIPVSKLTMDYIKVPGDAFKLGEEIPAVVTEIDHNNRKLYLSTVDYFKGREDAEVQAYLDAHQVQDSGNTLGDAGLVHAEESAEESE
jgi:small subunit ribosomal protein S1